MAVACLSTVPAAAHAAEPLPYTGVNLAGGEFYTPKPGVTPIYGTNFEYPNAREFDYFVGKGMNLIRLQFLWETLQPEAHKPFRSAEIARLRDVVNLATSKGLTVLIDPHNYARYYGKVVGGPDVSNSDFADFWGSLAAEFKNNPKVWFGLVNEPHDMPTDQWLVAANAAIAAIRKSGAKNKIAVPGNAWTGAHGWMENWYGTSNGVAMLKIQDPANNYIFEAHQYLDSDSSGTKTTIVSPTIGSERLKQFTEWCRVNHKKALLGEFAVPVLPEGKAAVDDMLTYMEKNRDVWVGFTWWAAGPRWGDYMFTIEPKNGADRPQMDYLQPHLHGK